MVPCDKELMRTMIVTVVSPVFVAFLSDDIFYDIFWGAFLPEEAATKRVTSRPINNWGSGKKTVQ